MRRGDEEREIGIPKNHTFADLLAATGALIYGSLGGGEVEEAAVDAARLAEGLKQDVTSVNASTDGAVAKTSHSRK